MIKSSIFDLIRLSWSLLYKFSPKRTLLVGFLVIFISSVELTSLIFVYPLLKFVINPKEEISFKLFTFLPDSLVSSANVYILLIISLFFILLSSSLRVIGIKLFSKYSFQVASDISSWRFRHLTHNFDDSSMSMHSASKILQEVKEFPIKLPIVLILPSLQIPQASLSLLMILSYTIITSFFSSIFILSCIAISYFLVYSLIKPRLYRYGEKINLSSKRVTTIVNNFSTGWKEIFAYNLVRDFTDMISESFSLSSFYSYKTYSLSATPKIALESLILSAILLCAFTSIILKLDVIAGLALISFAFLKALPYMQTLFGAFSGLANNMNLIETLHLKDYLRPSDTMNYDTQKLTSHGSAPQLLKISNHQLNLSIYLPQNSTIKSNNSLPVPIVDGTIELVENFKIAVVGPSGSGKSLLLDYIAGVRDYNYKIVPPSPNKSFTAYSTQTPMIAPTTLVDNISLQSFHDSQINKSKLLSIFDFLELTKVIEKYKHIEFSEHHNLSGGEAQRVSIARSLISTARLLILDEPTSPLHPALAEKFLSNLPNYIYGKTLFISLHSNKIPDWIDLIIELS